MQICKLDVGRLDKAIELVRKVFDECDAEDYSPIGIQTFRHFVRRENIFQMFQNGEMVFWGAYVKNDLVGVIAMRNGFHISLLFVQPDYQRQGIAKRLVRCGIAYCMEQNPKLSHITVNSSPKGKKAYEAMGFYGLSPEQIKDGMRFTPMRIDIG